MILLTSCSLTRRCLRGFSSRRVRIRHDNWDGIHFWYSERHSCTTVVFTKLNEFDKMPQKTPSTVETYNFLSLQAIFYRFVRVRSFECVVWKMLVDYFVVWKLGHVSNFFTGRFLSGSARILIWFHNYNQGRMVNEGSPVENPRHRLCFFFEIFERNLWYKKFQIFFNFYLKKILL